MDTTSDSREYGNTEQYHKNGLRIALLLNALHFRGVIPSQIRVHRQRGFVFLQIDAFHGASPRLRIYNAKALLIVAYNHTRRIGPRAALIQKACVRQLRNGLVLLDVSAYWQQTVIGAVIILAVALDNLRHMKKKA